jgi:hypothetical protein
LPIKEIIAPNLRNFYRGPLGTVVIAAQLTVIPFITAISGHRYAILALAIGFLAHAMYVIVRSSGHGIFMGASWKSCAPSKALDLPNSWGPF